MSDQSSSAQVKMNLYAEGRVGSLSFKHDSRKQASIGVFMPGEYTFTPDSWEFVQILSGAATLANKALPFQVCKNTPSKAFLPPLEPGVPFTISCKIETAYLCIYSTENDIPDWPTKD